MVVPNIPNVMVTDSTRLNLSLISTKARAAAKTGPVVKLIVLDRAKGMKAMAAYCIDFDTRLSRDLKRRIFIELQSYTLRSKLTPESLP
eukprot:CAMPEP_0168613926 /NCGR_PEP_ID=MMETSP0449_2-20121227/3705_1 /TAXON_ID=1082188 /ORGANISM="Strombidium rassoulzadegani, Strain ras09" /LENGTH=88 /DNA_ID=CAMNT_0008654579 /DNA_START=707 /DNA_END=973 /DNA_ORIENTATION=+